MPSNPSEILETVRAAVQARGLLPVARDLGLARTTLSSVLAGSARPGTLLLVEARWRALATQAAQS